jgi:hypothetical protein
VKVLALANWRRTSILCQNNGRNAAGGKPVVSTRMGVVNGAGFEPERLPGAWITIYGSSLSSTTRS